MRNAKIFESGPAVLRALPGLTPNLTERSDMNEVTPERWLPVVGYEGLYEVSDLGRVRSLIRQGTSGRVLRSVAGKYGHRHLNLYRDGRSRTVFVHWLVAEAFIGPRPDGQEVRHDDGDAANNSLTNLLYGTHSENELDKVRHGTHWNASKTSCPQDHEYTPENTGRDRDGGRWCRACARERGQERQRRRGVAA